ncbi:putative Zn finger-like uncharacterized protein [Rubrivivax gelatinosus]|uniref:zinc-ribbon and DUF3426 domain-containing protein n=2 Tax=Rubrivivax gelatinosus TaxID=28068 RepID=UPI0018C8F142|nr:zinc-ribbon and DUF3426 domain-containing protein [Rubrivivax gelatinosus]MBG6079497.1 putative Zn finger-like uncharacterized protein [Rubrivivax gelatinosus]
MTLAARCPSCGTVFRVVQDQLRVSDGWVRCGRCGEVFNAIQNLVDLDVETPVPPPQRDPEPAAPSLASDPRAPWDVELELPPPHSPTPASAAPAPPATAPHDEAADETHAETVLLERTPEDTEPAWDLPPPSPAGETVADAPDFDEPPARNAELPFDEPAPPLEAPAPAPAAPAPEPKPAFLRHAERRERWRRPQVRAALAAVCVLGTVGLVAQAAYEYRDFVAARWPAARPALEALCRAPDCTIGAPRAIEGLSVESSGLVRVEGTAMYQLQLLLRNRSALPLAMPSLDLTLSDSRGGIVARRVLTPEQAGLRVSAVAPAAEMPIQVTLTTAGKPVAGYTIEIFYP